MTKTRLAPSVIFVFVLCTIAFAQIANASVITILDSITPAGGGMWDFNYQIDLSVAQALTPPSASQPWATFGTLYDAGTTNPLSMITNIGGPLASDFTFSAALTDTPAFKTMPVDDPTLWNLRYTYTGTSTIAGPMTPLLTFSLLAPTNTFTIVDFDGQDTMNAGVLAGLEAGNVGTTAAPTPVAEPASFLLLGGGFLGVGLIRYRRLRKERKNQQLFTAYGPNPFLDLPHAGTEGQKRREATVSTRGAAFVC